MGSWMALLSLNRCFRPNLNVLTIKMQYPAAAAAALMSTTLSSVVIRRNTQFLSSSTSHHVPTSSSQQRSNFATASVFASLTKTSTTSAVTMDHTLAFQQQPRGWDRPVAFPGHQYVQYLWRRRRAISIWLLEHTIIFLAATRIEWALASDGLMIFGSLARTYFRLPKGPYPPGVLEYTFGFDLWLH